MDCIVAMTIMEHDLGSTYIPLIFRQGGEKWWPSGYLIICGVSVLQKRAEIYCI